MKSNHTSMEKVLLKKAHILGVHHVRRLRIPVIDASLWSEEYRNHQKTTIRHCSEFLGMPLIEDDFADIHKRKEWVYQMERRYANFDDFYNRNALRYTQLNGLSMCIHGFDEGYEGTNPEEFHRLKEEAETFIPSVRIYDKIVTPVKIRLVRGFKAKILEMLRFLSHQIPLKENANQNKNSYNKIINSK